MGSSALKIGYAGGGRRYWRGVSGHVSVGQFDAAWHSVGDVLVVGDDDDSGPVGVQFPDQGEDGLAGGTVQVAGWLVGRADAV